MKPTSFKLTATRRRFIVLCAAILCCVAVFAQPSNDNCTGATSLTSNTSCNNNDYRMKNATASSGIPAGCAAGGTHYDVWFSFTAASTSHTVTISSLETSFTNPEIQLFSGTCGTLTSLVCGTLTMTGTGLTIGNTYYIRVSNIGTQITNNNDEFDICVTHPNTPPANDDCSGATTITSGNSCTNTTGTFLRATSNGPAGACGTAPSATNTYDVWYRFQAVSDSQTVTIGNLGSRLTATTTYMEVFSGTCGSLTSMAGCQNVSGANARRTLSGFTVGSFYYIRLYVQTNPTAGTTTESGFNICVQNPPPNDECAGAIALSTPGTTCNATSGSFTLATVSSTIWGGACGAAVYYDIWYSFVAGPAGTHVVNLGNLGSSLNATNLRIQLYSGTCAGLTTVTCVTGTTLTQAGLTNGATYYVRVGYTAYQLATGSGSNFTICVTTGAAPPANDNCSGAISLTSSSTCTTIAGTIHNATASSPAVPGSCGTGQDVWYSFVAQTAYPQIQLSGIGTSLQSSNGRLQLLTGSCGTFTTVGTCVTITGTTGAATLNTATNPGGVGLTVGQTYYIRIAHNTSTSITSNGNFNICVTDPASTASAILDYSKSYVNLSDTATGGTIDPGDILEIRATLVVRPNGGGIRYIDSVAYYDTLKAGGGLHYYDSIALRTNEGKLYKYFTESNVDADAGWMTTGGAGTDTTIQINMGTGATRSARGVLNSASVPRFNTGTNANCIILATYRVVVNASYGETINFGGGAFSYRDQATGAYRTIEFPPDSIMIFQSPGSCPNSVSQTNILGDESNGTFGIGNTQNRGTSPNTNYLFANFAGNAPQDYYYGIANNTSATGSTNQLLAKSNAARVHGVWDISGDHTGATNTAKGNLPVSPGVSGGYMLAINASYKTDVAFDFNVSGACPSTYYEISFWLKNICYKCGCDSLGRFTGNAGYIPTATGDSSGVKPNIAIQINGKDYYTTGNIRYRGLGGTQTGSDTLNEWVQRSFVYQTGAGETSFTMTLRNNAPGGGGNDWAIDDIAFKTCTPELQLLPGPNPFTCDSNVVEMSTVVRSYYNNYNHYMWERSIDGGVTWTSTGEGGVASPVLSGGGYEYTVDYPPFIAYYADSGSMYRVVVATSASNLAGSCSFNESAEITLNVDPCGSLLNTDILSFQGKNENNRGALYWNTSKETAPVTYEIQKSKDGSHFEKIGELEGFKKPDAENNAYRFLDPETLDNTISYYRIKAIKTQDNKFKYSKVVQLIGDKAGLRIESLINPFISQVKFDLISGDEGIVQVQILDQYQHVVKALNHTLIKGKNNITIANTENLPAGFYILRVVSGNNVINRKIIKNG